MNNKKAPAIAVSVGSAVLRGERSGESHAPCLVFLYGLGCAISHWRHQLMYFQGQRFEEKLQTLWFDYRGHGQSSPLMAGESLTLATAAEDVIRVIEHNQCKGVTLLGQSLGGTIALCVASRRPDLIGRLVLIGAPARAASRSFHFGGASSLVWKLLADLNALARPSFRPLNLLVQTARIPIRELVRLLGFNPLRSSTADVDAYVRALAKTDFNVFFDLARDLEGFDVARLMPRVQCPVLVIAGRRDLVVPPREIDYLTSFLPNVEIEWMPAGSHCPHLDDPAVVNFRIELFLRDCGAV